MVKDLVNVRLPDGSVIDVEPGKTVREICEENGLKKESRKAVAALLDSNGVDLSRKVVADTRIQLIPPDDDEGLGLGIIRHSCAHVMAEAVLRRFPKAKPTIGPVVGERFYYDFDTSGEDRAISVEDFEAIEKEMAEIIKENRPFSRREMSVDDAKKYAAEQGNPYKVENIEAAAENGATIISIYKQGEAEDDFEDVCRGPHVASTGRIGAFKLLSVAGTTWHGESDGAPLQRLYGTAWSDRKALKQYLHRLDEARKRDHRKLGVELDIFSLQPELAPGQVFWHDPGMTILREMEAFLREVLFAHGYQEVRTPIFLDRKLWEISGHWEKFRDRMFTLTVDDREYAVKPMNCPGACLIYKTSQRSYRELPLRLAEFGHDHRNEARGELHGLLRLRGFVQDDAHIFCTEEQLLEELTSCMKQVNIIYRAFGLGDRVRVELSTRPEGHIGTGETWDRAEAACEQALDSAGIAYTINPGDAAFYGPKIDFHLTDCLGRSWQTGTVQVDYILPERFELEYVDSDNARRRPVLVHRALIGTIERFMGILIEEYAGAFPVWLAPVQARIACIADRHAPRSEEVAAALKAAGIRAEADVRNEKIGAKKAGWRNARVPYFGVVGDRELESGQVAVTVRPNRSLGPMDVDALAARIREEIDNRTIG